MERLIRSRTTGKALLIFCFVNTLFGTDLEIGQVRLVNTTADFELHWKNSWRNSRNHDAVWVILRSNAETHRDVVRLAASGHKVESADPRFGISVPEDQLGAFIFPESTHRGEVRVRVSLKLDQIPMDGIAAWALEMVYIPAGPFALGDADPRLVADGSFFRVGDQGEPAGPFRVLSEAPIPIQKRAGNLYYEVGDLPQYRGDQQGPIPADYPKGTAAFYIMKYEMRQAEYARFLSALPEAWQKLRTNHTVEGEEAETCSIRQSESGFVAEAPQRPCNFVSWADSSAFADWMALRPMTELEFEKAARGPIQPTARDYPWGTSSRNRLHRTVSPERNLRNSTAGDEAGLAEHSEEVHGASFYWVMDLSGSLWERVVSAGHPAGRTFRGTHGDGLLDPVTGEATNSDWPAMDEAGQTADGVGYRGGAEYFGEPGLTNPNSPVASRTFAAWNGSYRYKTYSARAVRTAPQPD